MLNSYGFFCKKGDMFKQLDKRKEIDKELIYTHINGEQINICEKDIINGRYIILYGKGLPLDKYNVNRGDLICEINNYIK